MSDDELERLRAILSKTHSKPERSGILRRIFRIAKRLLMRPKRPSVQRLEKNIRKKNAA